MWYFCEGVRGSKLRIIMLFVDTFRGIGLWMKADIARGWANRSSAAIIYRRQGHFNGFHEIEVFDFTIIINFFGLTPLLTISRLFHLYLPPIALITIRINSSPALPKSWQGNNFEPHILHNLFLFHTFLAIYSDPYQYLEPSTTPADVPGCLLGLRLWCKQCPLFFVTSPHQMYSIKLGIRPW